MLLYTTTLYTFEIQRAVIFTVTALFCMLEIMRHLGE